jgi:hypothetical protein
MTDCIDRELREVVVGFLNKLVYHGQHSITLGDVKRLDALLKTPAGPSELAPGGTATVASPEGQHGAEACQPISGASGVNLLPLMDRVSEAFKDYVNGFDTPASFDRLRTRVIDLIEELDALHLEQLRGEDE